MTESKESGPRKAPRKPPKAAPAKSLLSPAPFVDSTFLAAVGAGRSSATFQPNQSVYRQGDPADAVHYIESGKIQLKVVSEQGKEAVIAMLQPGEFFGEGCIVSQPLRMASASATEKATVIRIEKTTMIRVLNSPKSLACSRHSY